MNWGGKAEGGLAARVPYHIPELVAVGCRKAEKVSDCLSHLFLSGVLREKGGRGRNHEAEINGTSANARSREFPTESMLGFHHRFAFDKVMIPPANSSTWVAAIFSALLVWWYLDKAAHAVVNVNART
jgi:hypothetical protein